MVLNDERETVQRLIFLNVRYSNHKATTYFLHLPKVNDVDQVSKSLVFINE